MKRFDCCLCVLIAVFQFRVPSDVVQLCFPFGIQYNLPSSGINNVRSSWPVVADQSVFDSLPLPLCGSRYLVNKTNLDGGRCPGRPPFYPAYVNALGTRQMFTLTAVGPKLSTTLPLPHLFPRIDLIVFPRFFFFLKKLSSQRSVAVSKNRGYVQITLPRMTHTQSSTAFWLHTPHTYCTRWHIYTSKQTTRTNKQKRIQFVLAYVSANGGIFFYCYSHRKPRQTRK